MCGIIYLTQPRIPLVNSAEGAALSSRGRKAVDQAEREELRLEGAALSLQSVSFLFNVAPSALGIRFLNFFPRPYGRGYLMPVLWTFAAC